MNAADDLSQLLNNKRFVPIVGAGVSMSLKKQDGKSAFPSWTKLLQDASEELSSTGKSKVAKGIQTFIDLEMFQEAANLAKSAFTGTLWGDFLSKELDIPLSEISFDSLALPKAIWEISNRIITLNFDKVLRYACPDQSIIEFDNSQPAVINNFVRNANSKHYVWHLHGRVDNVSSLVFATEGYSDLYKTDLNYNAAILSLRNIASTESLLFVGCSLADADLISEIANVADLFQNNIGPHYALVHKDNAGEVRKKLAHLPFDVIEFDSFGYSLVEAVKKFKRKEKPQETIKGFAKDDSFVTKIAIIIADPIDKIYQNYELVKSIKKLKVETHQLPLTLNTLNQLRDFTYIFILTTVQRGKVIIEDEWLASQRLGVDELIENIDYTRVSGIFVFLDSLEIDSNDLLQLSNTSAAVSLYGNISKSQSTAISFKILRKHTPQFTDDCLVINRHQFAFDIEESGAKDIFYRTPLPILVDPKALRNFIGRSDDLTNLCKKVLEHKEKSDIVTVKGSGGIGKTSLVKMALIEFSKRNLFSFGISFIDCEFIDDFSNFQNQVGRVFGFQVDNLQITLQQHRAREDQLLVLDNVESLLVLPQANEIKNLISFLSDFCTVLVTSRERLDLENEVVINVRRFTTDEAFELFCNEMELGELSDTEVSFVRERIIEDLLDNNPLAIKLVTRNTPKGKNLKMLVKELDDDVFSKVKDDDISIFSGPSDRNVERKRSIFASINYSYRHLNEKEKIAFELLSLFPDGINMEAFKRISAQTRSTRKRNLASENNPIDQFLVTDAIIKSLESKSVIEIDNNNVYLQSLVGRFAENLLKKRSAVELKKYRKNAFLYNFAIGKALVNFIDDGKLVADNIFSSYQKNFLKCLGVKSRLVINAFDE